MLQEMIFPSLLEKEGDSDSPAYFQQDGVPSHYRNTDVSEGIRSFRILGMALWSGFPDPHI